MRALIAFLLIVPMFALTAGCDKQEPEQPQAAAPAAEPQGKVDRSHKGEEMPAMPFTRPEGGPATLTGFRGKPLLVNLWATWCAPCIKEMPMLDELAVRETGKLQLIVVSQDLGGKKAVDPFFAKQKFKALQPYLDSDNVLPLALKADSLPVTVLYDRKGKEVWRVLGAFDWTGAEAKALIDEGTAG